MRLTMGYDPEKPLAGKRIDKAGPFVAYRA